VFVPHVQGAFQRLAILVLQRNRLSEPDDLVHLSHAPRLKELNLGFNYFHRIPKDAVASKGAFSHLEWLCLANNYFSAEDDILFLVKMPCLKQV
jgi:hypothetical protein